MTAKRELPADLMTVALIDVATCCATGQVSPSWWHDEVRAGRAPAPVVQRHRYTRWRLADVSAFWAAFAVHAEGDIGTVAQVKARAKKASSMAQAKRRAGAQTAAAQ